MVEVGLLGSLASSSLRGTEGGRQGPHLTFTPIPLARTSWQGWVSCRGDWEMCLVGQPCVLMRCGEFCTVSPLHVKLESYELSKVWTCVPACLCQLWHCTTVPFKVLYCQIKNIFFIFCVCFLCAYYLCKKVL